MCSLLFKWEICSAGHQRVNSCLRTVEKGFKEMQTLKKEYHDEKSIRKILIIYKLEKHRNPQNLACNWSIKQWMMPFWSRWPDLLVAFLYLNKQVYRLVELALWQQGPLVVEGAIIFVSGAMMVLLLLASCLPLSYCI